MNHIVLCRIPPEKRGYRQVEIPAIPSVQQADLSFSGLEGVARSNPEQLDIEELSREGSSSKAKADYYSQFCYSVVIT